MKPPTRISSPRCVLLTLLSVASTICDNPSVHLTGVPYGENVLRDIFSYPSCVFLTIKEFRHLRMAT
ncbi:MAG: hypothetical protein LBL82_03715 [Oscillospiraceae bacterium]|nr:hypothetical protein [Oscillospiraceae bacterium]